MNKKTTINNDRMSLLTNASQLKSNYVIEGFSAIIVGWIPLELGIQRKREQNKMLYEKQNTIHVLISELEDLRNYIDTREKTILTIDENSYQINGASLSDNGLKILISSGLYQELFADLQSSISKLYQQLHICNDFQALLNQTLIYQSDSNNLSKKWMHYPPHMKIL